MSKITDVLNKNKNNEDGAGELYSALVVIPIMIILLVSIIDVGGYYLAAGRVADMAKEASRQVAIYGGSDSTLSVNKLGTSVSSNLSSLLYKNGSCTQSRCTKPPVVTCTTKNGGAAGLIQPGDYVNCTVRYSFDSVLSNVVPTAAGPLNLGIVSFLEDEKEIIQYSVAETWGN
jgi:Flp pilus assembly protein TadG